jgi:hypothetical protein
MNQSLEPGYGPPGEKILIPLENVRSRVRRKRDLCSGSDHSFRVTQGYGLGDYTVNRRNKLVKIIKGMYEYPQ